jgi:hypothetical protein
MVGGRKKRGEDAVSAHYEWLTARGNPAELLRKGDEIHGYDEPVTEDLALVFGDDNGAIIEGSKDELLAMLNLCRQLVESG